MSHPSHRSHIHSAILSSLRLPIVPIGTPNLSADTVSPISKKPLRHSRGPSGVLVGGSLLTVLVAVGLPTQPVVYADYTAERSDDLFLNSTLAFVTLFKDVSALVPHAGPLKEILGGTKELILVINEVRDLQGDADFLIERILNFVKLQIQELGQLAQPLESGTPTAARLFALME
jgi:hypothetical protein